MDFYYPNTTWLHIDREVFAEIYSYKRNKGFTGWDETLRALADTTARGELAMNLAPVEAIVKAVLYEGYILYPYRASNVKNRQRWTFGGVYPRDYARLDGPVLAEFRPNVWFRATSGPKSRRMCDFCISCGERSGNLLRP